MLQNLLSLVVALYQVAVNARLDECPGQLLSALQTAIPFDGAALAKAQVSDPRFLDAHSVVLHGRDANLLNEYKRLASEDLLHTFARGPMLRPLVFSYDHVSPDLRKVELLALVRRHHVYQMLAYTTPDLHHGPDDWVALFAHVLAARGSLS